MTKIKTEQQRLRNNAAASRWRRKHREQFLEYGRQYRITHKDSLKRNRDKYYAENKEMLVERQKTQYRKNPKKSAFINAKSRAKRNGIPFTITLDDVPDIPELCPIANIPIRNSSRSDYSPSLDKIDNIRGYVPGNVSIISLRGNRWKSDMKVEDVERLLKYIKNGQS